LKTSGSSFKTAARASWFPAKSGVSTSTRGVGERRRRARMVAAKCSPPPSGRSSLVTEVITTYRSLINLAAWATRSGSSPSTGSGVPEVTAQKRQCRAQTSPKIMKVAVPLEKQMPLLGQRAWWQTVFSRRRRRREVISRVCRFAEMGCMNQPGSRVGALCAGVLFNGGLAMITLFCENEPA
jgi:hypothetical protein